MFDQSLNRTNCPKPVKEAVLAALQLYQSELDCVRGAGLCSACRRGRRGRYGLREQLQVTGLAQLERVVATHCVYIPVAHRAGAEERWGKQHQQARHDIRQILVCAFVTQRRRLGFDEARSATACYISKLELSC